MTASLHSLDQHSVLELVRSALRRDSTLVPAPLEPFIEPIGEADQRELIGRFTREAEAVGAQVYRVSDKNQLVEKIAGICANQPGEIALSEAEFFTTMDLASALVTHGLAVFTGNEPDHDKLTGRLANCGVGVTCADYAIAETGTIVLSSDEQNALLVSLLPPVHLAVVRSSQIVARLDQAISKINQERFGRVDPAQSVSFITGPSRTSDVELVLSIGVHGPKELHVIILEM